MTTQQRIIVPENDGDGTIYDHDCYMRHKIYYSSIDASLTKRMLDHAWSVQQSSVDMRFDLAGALDNEKKISFQEDMNLFTDVSRMITYHASNFMKSNMRSAFVDTFWVNFMRANEYNPVHMHYGSLSWVWYLDIPEVIRQECQNDTARTKQTKGLIEFVAKGHEMENFLFNPKTSDFFMFTSDHLHTVYPFQTEGVTRVSMSGNISNYDFF